MNRVRLLPPGAWLPAPGGVEAALHATVPGRLGVWAWGWDAATGGLLLRDGAAPVALGFVGELAFASTEAAGADALRLRARLPPRRCLIVETPAGPSPTLAAVAPRALLRAPAARAPDLAAARERMVASLAAADLDGALAALAEMLVTARAAPETMAAAAALLDHLARHPLLRGPALGALAAALTE